MSDTRWTVRRGGVVIVLFGLLLLGGCQASRLVQMFGSPAEEQAARHYLDLLRERQFDAIESVVDPTQRTPGLRSKLEAMASYVPAQAPTAVQVVGVGVVEGDGMRTVSYAFQCRYPGRWLLLRVVRRTRDGSTFLLGLSVQPLTDSLESTNRFTLHGKHPLQLAVLLAAIVVPLFCVVALVVCVRTPMRGRKWPWVLFILFGVVSVTVNWTTGAWDVHPLSFLLLGAAVGGTPFGPWSISVACPLGAVWFLLRRPRLLAAATEAGPPALPEDAAG